jgi:hypothetical protein
MNAASNVVVFEKGTVVSFDETSLMVTVMDPRGQSKYKVHSILERA